MGTLTTAHPPFLEFRAPPCFLQEPCPFPPSSGSLSHRQCVCSFLFPPGAPPPSSFLREPRPTASLPPAAPPLSSRSPAPSFLLLEPRPTAGLSPEPRLPANPCPPSSRSPALSAILSFLLPKPRPPPITGRLSPGVRPSCLSLSFFLPKSRPTANPCLPSSRSPAPGQSLSSFLWSPAPRLFLFFLLAPSQSLSCFLPEARPPANPGAPSSGAPPHCPSVGPKPARPALRLARTWRPVVQSVPPAGPGRWALPVVEKHCGSGARPFLSLRPGWRAGCGRAGRLDGDSGATSPGPAAARPGPATWSAGRRRSRGRGGRRVWRARAGAPRSVGRRRESAERRGGAS
ncbi:translation initiation factor IF-2-like [Canis lupus familiaris]|uniref:translation initiation factor IF-2-like n=1 Tax=Canis lupus familiaris TaxID=9615 RepID=UPI0018F3EA89|nr:translation initiation factor IF-2-like [Canis lupus familiaris]